MLEYNNFNSSISPSISNYGLQEYFQQPAVAVGGAMETSSSGTVRGIGAGIRTIGAPLTENIGKEIVTKGLTKDALSTGFKNTFNFKGAAGAGFGMGAAGEVLNAIAGPKREYSGYKGDVTKGLDAAYDGIQTAVSFIPGVGQIVGGAMGLAKGVGSMFNKWGGGTDAMTDVDATLGSNFFSWNVGAINGFTGKKSHTMDNQDFMNQSKLDQMWSGYSGALDTDLYAQTKAGKKYGGFSSGARKRANRIIDTANMNREHLLNMQNETYTGDIRGNLMAGINSAAYNQELYGGIKPVLAGKQGLKFNQLKQVVNLVHNIPRHSNVTPWKPQDNEISKFQLGGKPKLNSKETGEDPVGYSENGTPLYRKGDGTIGPSNGEDNLFELIRNSNANFAKRLQDPNRKYITYPDGSWGNFKLAWSEDETGTIVYPEIQEINGELVDLSNDKEAAWKSAIKHGDYVYFPSNEAAEWFTKNYKDYYKGFNKTPQAFKQGGSMNVIPEGSLHARLHHMEDADGLTKKGIPVVDNNGNQQAEIELNEIIFRKEVTDKLEELAKDGSAEAAIEAGKLLVEEIFENTDDRTGLIEQITGEANLQGAEVFKEGGIVKAGLGDELVAPVTYKEQQQNQQKATQITTADKKKLKTSLQYANSLDKQNALLKQQTALGFTQALGKGMEGLMDAFNGSQQARQKREEQLNDAFTNQMEYSNELADLRNWMSTVIKLKEDEQNQDRKELYAQTHAEPVLSAQEGEKLQYAGEDVVKEILSLSPEKLQELQNILKYLKND